MRKKARYRLGACILIIQMLAANSLPCYASEIGAGAYPTANGSEIDSGAYPSGGGSEVEQPPASAID